MNSGVFFLCMCTKSCRLIHSFPHNTIRMPEKYLIKYKNQQQYIFLCICTKRQCGQQYGICTKRQYINNNVFLCICTKNCRLIHSFSHNTIHMRVKYLIKYKNQQYIYFFISEETILDRLN